MKQLASIVMLQLVMDLGANPPVAVTLDAPADGATVSGTVQLSATASSTMGPITRIEFYLDGKLVGVAGQPPVVNLGVAKR